jgi:hypothetical protein
MRTLTGCSALLAAVAAVGCGSSPQKTSTLATWSKAQLVIQLDYAPQGTALQSVSASLNNDFLAGGIVRAGFGALGADVKATIDGLPMDVVSHGSDAGEWPIFRRAVGSGFPNPAAASSSIVLTDASGTVTMQVASLFAPRTFAMTAPAGGAIHAGDAVQLTWSPATDVLDPLSVTLVGTAGHCGKQVVPTGASSFNPTLEAPGLAASGAIISFPVPPDWTCTGPAFLQPTIGALPEVTTCAGVGECVALLPTQVLPTQIDVTVR